MFTIGSNLATDQEATPLKAASVVETTDIEALENEIDRMDLHLPALRYFVLPGGTQATAAAHICRTVTRRAERRVLDLQQGGMNVEPLIINYLNRLSDYLFVYARYLAMVNGITDDFWYQ